MNGEQRPDEAFAHAQDDMIPLILHMFKGTFRLTRPINACFLYQNVITIPTYIDSSVIKIVHDILQCVIDRKSTLLIDNQSIIYCDI